MKKLQEICKRLREILGKTEKNCIKNLEKLFTRKFWGYRTKIVDIREIIEENSKYLMGI